MRITILLVTFVLGTLLGGWWLQDTRPRAALALTNCNNCMHPNEVTGLLTAGLIQNNPSLTPSVALETDKAIAIYHPAPQTKFHFVVFPKKDIKNLGDIGETELEYASEVIAVTAKLIQEHNLKNYKVWSNGPRTQLVGYLHFHLAGSDE